MGLESSGLPSPHPSDVSFDRVGGSDVPGSGALDLRQDLVRLRKSTRLVLGEDHFTVDGDVEDSSASADQFGFDAEHALDRSCQTGSSRQVISLTAIGNRDLHADNLPSRIRPSHGITFGSP